MRADFAGFAHRLPYQTPVAFFLPENPRLVGGRIQSAEQMVDAWNKRADTLKSSLDLPTK